MAERRPHVLIAGVSTRALAVSAARAGYRVTAVDAFGDVGSSRRGRGAPAPPRRCARFTPAAAAAARGRARDAPTLVAYTSNFENHPDAVAALARGRRLLGNPPAVLARVRNPHRPRCGRSRRRGFAVPDDPRERADAVARRSARWLLKPRRSGGGHGTAAWSRGRPVSRGAYLQERIARPAGLDRLRRPTAAAPSARPLAAAGGRARVRRARLPLLRQPARGRASAAVRAAGGAAGRADGAGGRGDRGVRARGAQRPRLHRPGRRAAARSR